MDAFSKLHGNLVMESNCTEPNADGSMLCEFSDGTMAIIRNVYPPIQDMQPRILAVVLVFCVCFIVGICGSTSVITIIHSVLKERRGRTRKTGDNAIFYVGALCFCDFLMSLSLPPAILDSLIGFWIFGTPMCKLHHLLGSVGRIGSTFLITAMSFDRYVAVCYPHIMFLRCRAFVFSVIIGLSLGALLLLTPLLIYAHAKEVVLHELKSAESNIITRVRVFKCTDSLPTNLFYWFTVTTFICGYVVPLSLICFFNFRLARTVCQHKKATMKSAVPAKRIVVYTSLIASIYFLCWTPYWCSVLYAIFMSLLEKQADAEELLLFAIFMVHLLPYLCSATNWVFYGLLNTQLQQRTDIAATVTQDNPTNVRVRCEGRGLTPTISRSTALEVLCDESSQKIRFIQETQQTML